MFELVRVLQYRNTSAHGEYTAKVCKLFQLTPSQILFDRRSQNYFLLRSIFIFRGTVVTMSKSTMVSRHVQQKSFQWRLDNNLIIIFEKKNDPEIECGPSCVLKFDSLNIYLFFLWCFQLPALRLPLTSDNSKWYCEELLELLTIK